VITGRARAASVRITSDYARIVTINGERLHSLMRQDPAVSMHMLNIVANYIKN
jgi:CRP-like cAMP-binding protein